jgi:hypothetical protein
MYMCRYRIYIGYDKGHKLLDIEANTATPLHAWFSSHIATKAHAEGIDIQMVTCKVDDMPTHNTNNNYDGTPPQSRHTMVTAAYNYLAVAAVADGADFVYRVDPETVFLSAWPHAMVSAVAGLKPANVGVAMPVCASCVLGGGQQLEDHHFVHRCVLYACTCMYIHF